MKAKLLRRTAIAVMIAGAFLGSYLAHSHRFMDRPADRTSLALDRGRITRIEEILCGIDGTAILAREISPWVEFFNSLKLTYHKDGWIMYNRPGTHFVIYYDDGTTDTIQFHFGHLIYNGDFYDIDNHEGKTAIHDALRAAVDQEAVTYEFGRDDHPYAKP